MTHHLSACPRNWNIPKPCTCGSASRRKETEVRQPIGNAIHPSPKALVFCLCCGLAVEGNGYLVQYAEHAPPDVFCKRSCHDTHIAARCGCFELQQVRR